MNATPSSSSVSSHSSNVATTCVSAWVVALPWALLAVAFGASPLEGVLLVGLGAFTQMLALFAWDALKQDADFRVRSLWVCCAALAASLALGRLLLANTHHRPLGAVTWTLLVLCVGLMAWVIAGRLKTSWLVPAGLLGVLGVASLLQAMGHLQAHPKDWVQLGVGVIGLFAGVRLRDAVPARVAHFAWLPVLWMTASAVATVAGGLANTLHEHAPVVAGLFGLMF